MSEPLDIAIIGMAGCYAGSRNVSAFWQNILGKRDCVTDASPEWYRGVVQEQNTPANRIYTIKGGWLHDLAEFDPREFGIMPNAVDGREPEQMLALRNARDALADAGYLNKSFDRERAGIIMGRGNNMNRGGANLLGHGAMVDQMVEIVSRVRPDFSAGELDQLRAGLTAQLPPFNPEMLPGLIPNITTGMIANRLDLMGPNFIVDAACASSLVALEQSVRELAAGRCDLMLSGGVHAQTPPQSYMIFSQINALSRDRIRPFQKGSNGTLLGEGCGVLALKRREDAERDGDRIYAIIRGVGVASDGKGKGLFAPRQEGQVAAMRRAYEGSGIDPATIGLVEAHATGIALGDRTEVGSLKQIFGKRRGNTPDVALGSVKSMISHAIPASGAASLIKCALALQQKVLPPMLCDEPSPELELETSPFYINNETRPWVHGGKLPRRAGVNAFGFGGINAHVILEEYRPAPAKVQVAVLHAPVESEAVLLAAPTQQQLAERVRSLRARLDQPGIPDLAALAKACAASASGEHRLAMVVSDFDELKKKLDQALEKLQRPDCAPFKTRGGVHYGRGAAPGKLALLFPGEGAQYPGMLADVCVNFPQARAWFDFLEDTAAEAARDSRAPVVFPPPTALAAEARKQLEDRLLEGEYASESIFAASMALHTILQDLGIKADGMLGHSTGENTALTACKVRRYDKLSEIAESVHALNGAFQKLKDTGAFADGSLLTLGALRAEQREALLKDPGPGMIVAMDNCPNQLVLFGPRDSAAALKEKLSAEGVICMELPFGRPYHTDQFAPVADACRAHFKGLSFGPGSAALYSARSAAPFPDDEAGIKELAAQQWDHRVRFTETVQRMHADGYRVFVEVGPSGNLTGFVGDILRDAPDVISVATNSRRKSGIGQLQSCIAQLFAAGVPMNAQALFAQRQIAAFELDAPAQAPATKPKLSLMMPRLEWPAQMPVPPLPQAATATALPAMPAPAVGALASDDPRAAFLQTHFSLMQEFLDSQARVLGLAMSPPAATPAPVMTAPASEGNYPLLGRVIEHSAERLAIEHTLDLDRDLFLRDHTIGGAPSAHDASLRPIAVVPFTFSMEILAEAAAKFTGNPALRTIGIENSRGSRWLALDQGTLDLRIVCERAPARPGVERVMGRIFALNQGGPAGGLMVFEAVTLLAAQYPEAPAMRPWTAPDEQAPRNNTDTELYSRGMFHGPRLQGVTHLRRCAAQAMEADLVAIAVQDYFSFNAAPQFQFDAALLDAAGQLAGYWLTEQHERGVNCFPFRVGSVRTYAPPPAPGAKILCRADLHFTDKHMLEAHFDLVDESGRLIMRVDGWEDRVFATPQRLYEYRLRPRELYLSHPCLDDALPQGCSARRMEPFTDEFLDEGGGIWKRMLAHMVLNHAERREFHALPAGGARREEWLMARIAAKEALREWAQRSQGMALASADFEIRSDAEGRPSAHCAVLPGIALPGLSLTHSRRWAMALLTPPGTAAGLDYQRLQGVDAELLQAGAFTDAERAKLAAIGGSDSLRASAAIWCAKEAAAKAHGSGFAGNPLAWEVVEISLERRGGTQPRAQVRHGSLVFEVLLHLAGEQEMAATCTTAPRRVLGEASTVQ